jgi:hypothetical protein
MNERIAFGPKALSRFTHIVEEVTVELGDNGVLRSTEKRTRLAQKLFGLARFWWTDTQIKQLLLRALRNEASASRICVSSTGLDTPDSNSPMKSRLPNSTPQCRRMS